MMSIVEHEQSKEERGRKGKMSG